MLQTITCIYIYMYKRTWNLNGYIHKYLGVCKACVYYYQFIDMYRLYKDIFIDPWMSINCPWTHVDVCIYIYIERERN